MTVEVSPLPADFAPALARFIQDRVAQLLNERGLANGRSFDLPQGPLQ